MGKSITVLDLLHYISKASSDFLSNIDTTLLRQPINQLKLDSRKIESGDVFFAILGSITDGRQFISNAIAAGAMAIFAETNKENEHLHIEFIKHNDVVSVPVIYVYQLNVQLSDIADYFYQHPSNKMPVVGVTGTNGKTTVTQLIAQWSTLLHKKSAVLGTLGNGLFGQLTSSENTTSSAIDIQHYLADFNKNKVDVVAMEVSSHGLVLNRVKGISFSTVVFTNLSRDHLDFHQTMDNYALAKWSLFSPQNQDLAVRYSGHKIINYDDPIGRQWAAQLSNAILVSSQPNRLDELKKLTKKYVAVSKIDYHTKGASIYIESSWGQQIVESHLLGEFNVSNLLLALAAMITLDFSFTSLLNTLPDLLPICGRMERFYQPHQPVVVVDYAHTPDALEKALSALRIHCAGQLWVVFGCGGDRDAGKRPIMGAIAEQFADKVILTNDNPRTENERIIIEDILQGVKKIAAVKVIYGRQQAIEYVLRQAQEEDVILIAGKGHEDYQIIGKTKHHYSDREVITQLLDIKQGANNDRH